MSTVVTSERVHVDAYRDNAGDYLIYHFHIVAYRWFSRYATGKTVLDFGCGTGYGAYELSRYARRVDAVDISTEAIEFARANYRASNLTFTRIGRIEVCPLPFEDRIYDLVVSNQVIEHIREPERYLSEAKRVMTEAGVLVLATPDRTTRLFPYQRPWNQYHVREYSENELIAMLLKHFADVRIFGMGGEERVLAMELSRTAKLRFLTLPFTFPFAPDWWRVFGLKLLKRLKVRKQLCLPTFDETAVWIQNGVSPSVNIIAEARRG
jgi:SAM-dependent methyltransferase